MTQESPSYQLIVRQMPSGSPELEDLLRILHADFGLESYTARQRLIGRGLAMFGKGPLQQTQKIAGFLQNHGFACWVIPRSEPGLVPDRLRSLEMSADYVDFTCQNGALRLERGARVVAVLADLSGELSGKLFKRMINQKTYRGHIPEQGPALEELLKSIYQGRPVLDFYLFGEDNSMHGAVRVLPGKFNHTGLGRRAGLSAVLNLDALRRLIEEYAGDYRLDTDFGLGYLPDCQLVSMTETTRRTSSKSLGHGSAGAVEKALEVRENPSAVNDNLKSLTRYGWLVTQLHGDGRKPSARSTDELRVAAGIAASAVLGNQVLGPILAQQGDSPGATGRGAVTIDDLSGSEVSADNGLVEASSATEQRDLPQPPDVPEAPQTLGKPLLILGGIAAGVVIMVGTGGDRIFRLLAEYGMTAGVVPALIAGALFWSGFHFIALKRRVENTPTSKVRSIAMGLVEVHGQARRIYALVAPMSQLACAWYRLRKYRKDKNTDWKLVRQIDSNHVPFWVDDGTGRVMVEPAGAAIRAKLQQTGSPGQSALAFNTFDSCLDEDERWVEDVICEGTSLYVLGYAQPLHEKKTGLRERTMEKLRQLKLDPRGMHRYDTNGDGRIDQQEWEAARRDVEQDALREQLDEQGLRKRQEEHVLIARPPQRSLPFVIAETESEASLAGRYGWISLPLLFGGVAATALAIYKFLQFVKV